MADIRIDSTQKLKPNSNPNLRENTDSGLLNHLAKFAIDSTVNYALKFKALAGRKQVYEIVQERLKNQPLSTCVDDKKKLQDAELGMEEMQTKLEMIQEDTNIVEQQPQVSAKDVQGSDNLKKSPEESSHESDIPQNNRKRIFIRSRL